MAEARERLGAVTARSIVRQAAERARQFETGIPRDWHPAYRLHLMLRREVGQPTPHFLNGVERRRAVAALFANRMLGTMGLEAGKREALYEFLRIGHDEIILQNPPTGNGGVPKMAVQGLVEKVGAEETGALLARMHRRIDEIGGHIDGNKSAFERHVNISRRALSRIVSNASDYLLETEGK